MDFNQYVYDFSYSMTFETLKGIQQTESTATLNDQDQSFIDYCQFLLECECFAEMEVEQFATLLFKQALFRNIGLKIKSIAEIQFEDSNKNLLIRTKLQNLRLTLCQKVQQMHSIFKNQKDKYLNITILLLTLVLFKLYQDKNPQKRIEETAFFHLIHWQIKGKHSTNIAYECYLQNLIFRPALKRFIEGDINKATQGSIKTFREVRNSMNLKENQISNSFSGRNEMLNSCLPYQSNLHRNSHLFKKEMNRFPEQKNTKLTFGNSKKAI